MFKVTSATPILSCLPPPRLNSGKEWEIFLYESLEVCSKQFVHSNTEHVWYSPRIAKTQRAKAASPTELVHLERSVEKDWLLLWLWQQLRPCTVRYTGSNQYLDPCSFPFGFRQIWTTLLTEWRMLSAPLHSESSALEGIIKLCNSSTQFPCSS